MRADVAPVVMLPECTRDSQGGNGGASGVRAPGCAGEVRIMKTGSIAVCGLVVAAVAAAVWVPATAEAAGKRKGLAGEDPVNIEVSKRAFTYTHRPGEHEKPLATAAKALLYELEIMP
jgi:hypothetical protein